MKKLQTGTFDSAFDQQYRIVDVRWTDLVTILSNMLGV